MTYTNDQLKQALAKMLPEQLVLVEEKNLLWLPQHSTRSFDGELCVPVLDTELLHICWLIEKELDQNKQVALDDGIYHSEASYYTCLLLEVEEWPMLGFDAVALFDIVNATWQQRAIALAKVKGITI